MLPPVLLFGQKSPMSVSVVIPVRNGEAFIGEAINSVLAQGPLAGEVIVVDDGSTDGTAAVVKAITDPRVTLLTRPSGRKGVSAVRNFGLSKASGEWTMFLDADDRLREEAFATLLAGADGADDVAIYGDYERINEQGEKVGRRNLIRKRSKPSGQILENLVGGNFIVNGGIMLVKTAVFRAVGGFDETLRYGEDWHGWCLLAAKGPFRYVEGAHVLDYRVHTSSVMMTKTLEFADCIPVIDAIFNDPSILADLPSDRVKALRQKAEGHMNAYTIAQDIRAHRYGKAFMALSDTLIHRPRQAKRALLFSAAALAGL